MSALTKAHRSRRQAIGVLGVPRRGVEGVPVPGRLQHGLALRPLELLEAHDVDAVPVQQLDGLPHPHGARCPAGAVASTGGVGVAQDVEAGQHEGARGPAAGRVARGAGDALDLRLVRSDVGLQPLARVDAVLIDRAAPRVHLEVQVATRGVPAVSHLADLLARPHQLAVGHVESLHVRVPRRQTPLARADLDQPRPCPGLIRLDDDGASRGGANRGAAGRGQVGAGVAACPVSAAAAEVVQVGELRRRGQGHHDRPVDHVGQVAQRRRRRYPSTRPWTPTHRTVPSPRAGSRPAPRRRRRHRDTPSRWTA